MSGPPQFNRPAAFNPNRAQELYFANQQAAAQQAQQQAQAPVDPRQAALARDLGLEGEESMASMASGGPGANSDDSEDDDHYYQPQARQPAGRQVALEKLEEAERDKASLAAQKKKMEDHLGKEIERKRQAMQALTAAEEQMAKLRESSRQQLVLLRRERETARPRGAIPGAHPAGSAANLEEVRLLKQQIAQLQAQVAQAGAAGGGAGAAAAAASSGAEVVRLKAIIAQQDGLIKEAEGEVDENRADNERLREQLAASEAARRAAAAGQGAAAAAGAGAAKAQAEADQLRKRNAELESQVVRLRKEHDGASSDASKVMTEAMAEHRRLNEALAQAERDKVELGSRVARAEEEAREAARRAAAAEASAGPLKAGLRRLGAEVAAMRGVQDQLRKEGISLSRGAPMLVKGLEEGVTHVVKQASAGLDAAVARYRRECALRKKLHNELQDLKGSIRVLCRVRPLLPFEVERSGTSASPLACGAGDDDEEIRIAADGDTVKSDRAFQFDRVFPGPSSQEQVFEDTLPLVTSVLDGYNVCIFAYGQTGSGKTHTMEGTTADPGVNTRALAALFELRGERATEWDLEVRSSMVEIYNETVIDLVEGGKDKKLEIRLGQGGVHVPGLAEVPVNSLDDVWALIATGKSNRSTFSTNMNEHSSRSHSILSVTVEGTNRFTGAGIKGKLNLVDLAGSERVGKSEAKGDRLKEAQAINKSLSALGDVIAAMVAKSSHVPFRNSKLTYLLQDSLGGNSKTLMFVNLSPAVDNVSESLCSLNFASRVRNVELGQAKKNPASGGVGGGETPPRSPITTPSRAPPMKPSSSTPRF